MCRGELEELNSHKDMVNTSWKEKDNTKYAERGCVYGC